MSDLLNLIGRLLIALLFFGGAIQKIGDPAPVVEMITGIGLPGWLIWPVAAFNLVASVALITGPGIRFWALALAGYCIFTSYFHFQLRADPWQVTIMVKNWAIAGGLLILAAQGPGETGLGRRRAAKTGFQPDQK
ncbi:DoxX family protein [Maritimibacter sp. UBA3975]|uniref:DoxX family protein n=1 Tax=Maritimibacter sp. UBA3975 TaxID=1946833 RepID=UPI000C093E61|nr:DoxX family protein [Maritimibacter sp. UBA3975]MAM63576.1 DoxX protein [Maritimibacter sp.]|tara:strand:+ start:29558 stop:29962 length:405 start_codon:yes stop_codon:yes gene_type:complete